jgi:hypothetical protein
MAIESPLFQSAMELLGHSFSHFNGSNELDRKLVILHLANAIELILKDLVLDIGQSIYKGPKETITIYGCFKSLQDAQVPIPYFNKIELLIDERNALQHRFGSPNELTTIFYMTIAQDFFKQILYDHYNQKYDEILSQFVEEKDLVAYRMREPSDDTELDNLRNLAKVHSLGALLSAMSYLEKITFDFASKIGLENELTRKPLLLYGSSSYLLKFGIEIPDKLRGKLNGIRRLRNLAAHGRSDPTIADVDIAISTIEEFEKFLESVDVDVAKVRVVEHLSEMEDERERRRIDRNQILTSKLIQPELGDTSA